LILAQTYNKPKENLESKFWMALIYNTTKDVYPE
ncbi:hypothetical protein QA5_02783, partial [Enterococcus faecalis EnGen0083]